MTWKSYAVVSGATVLAGWLASATPPSSAPTRSASVSRQPGVDRDAPASDIQREAERLQARVRREVLYAQPQRDPFRFGDSRADEDRGGDIPASVPEPTVVIPAAPPPPPVSLSGIAEDQAGERLERTAILSSPSGVLLVREGDQVAGEYTVQRIESEAIDLIKSDGTILRLTLKP